MIFKTYNISDFLVSIHQNKHFHINRLEDMPPLPEHIESPHKHTFHEVFLVETGTLRQDVDDRAYQIKAHQLFFIAQGQLHIWHENIGEVKGFRLMFTEDFFQTRQNSSPFLHELLYLNNAYENPFLHINNFSKINILFEQLFEEYQSHDFKIEALQAYLFLILNEIQKSYNLHFSTVISNQDLLIYKKILNLVEQKYMTNASASDYAAQLFLTPKQLNKITESIENQTITNIILNRKVVEAKRLLLYSELTVAQISDHLGFEDYSYFNRFFKKNTTQTPGHYRQSKGK